MMHGSLFSGVGGFDLASEWMGWENVFHCEINEFCNRVLNYYWPNAKSYQDIKETDFTEWNGKVDIVSGGFPCQPFSMAGKRKGTADDRHLWPQMLRAIREIQPRWVVGENVPGIANWSRGMVFKQIQTDLENEGYEVFPVLNLPACSKDAPHKRERIWVIAHSNSERYNTTNRSEKDNMAWKECKNTQQTRNRGGSKSCGFNDEQFTTNAASLRQSGQRKFKQSFNSKKNSKREADRTYCNNEITIPNWENFPTQSPICSRDDGLSSELVGITFSKHRQESIKGYGNAIVPQVVYEIFKVIDQLSH